MRLELICSSWFRTSFLLFNAQTRTHAIFRNTEQEQGQQELDGARSGNSVHTCFLMQRSGHKPLKHSDDEMYYKSWDNRSQCRETGIIITIIVIEII